MVDTLQFENVEDVIGLLSVDDGDKISLVNEAYEFLARQKWCKSISKAYLCHFWEGILAILYFEIVPQTPNVDDSLWVIVGDISPAYFDLISCPTPRDALGVYIDILQEWVETIELGGSVEDQMPLYVRYSSRLLEPTKRTADMMSKRVVFYRKYLLPELVQ